MICDEYLHGPPRRQRSGQCFGRLCRYLSRQPRTGGAPSADEAMRHCRFHRDRHSAAPRAYRGVGDDGSDRRDGARGNAAEARAGSRRRPRPDRAFDPAARGDARQCLWSRSRDCRIRHRCDAGADPRVHSARQGAAPGRLAEPVGIRRCRRRYGRNWPAGPSGSSVTDGSVTPSPAGPEALAWKFARSAAMSADPPATIRPCLAVRTASTRCCDGAITSWSRCRQRRRRSVGWGAGSSV